MTKEGNLRFVAENTNKGWNFFDKWPTSFFNPLPFQIFGHPVLHTTSRSDKPV